MVAVFGVLSSFVLVFVFLVLFGIFDSSIYIILSLVCLVLTILFGILLARKNTGTDLRSIIKLHKEKENLLSQKNDFQKQYMKRQLSEKQFNDLILDLDKKIVLLDCAIESTISYPLVLGKKEFVQKQFFKGKISEDLYNALQKDFANESVKK